MNQRRATPYCRAAPEWQTQPSWEHSSLLQIAYPIYWGLRAVPGGSNRGRYLLTSDLKCVFVACIGLRVETSLGLV
jgi:hypothetical protein